MRSFVALVTLFAFGLTALPAAADNSDAYLELLRSDIKAETVAILTEVMEFSNEEGETFWPIYREYEVENAKIGDRRIALIKSYAENFDMMSEEKAQQLAKDYFKLQDDKLKLSKSYHKKVEKALGANTAARFVQVMNQINLLIDVQIAANLPLISKYTESVQKASR